MDTKADLVSEHGVSGVEHANPKSEVVATERQAEHNLTLKQVFRNHPALIWWSLYWAMAGVGW